MAFLIAGAAQGILGTARWGQSIGKASFLVLGACPGENTSLAMERFSGAQL
jgi:hypothetical protein